MSITKSIAKMFAAAVVTLVAFGMTFSFASALTTAELVAAGFTSEQAAVIMALLGDNDSSASSCDVYGLPGTSGVQMAVNQLGYTPALVVDGSYGPMTRAGVTWAQGVIGASQDGAWGPMTQAAYETYIANNCDEEETTTGGGNTGSTGLSGGAGSISDADYVSGLNNEKVGEDEEDVEVAGLSIEADEGSDIMIVAVNLNFSKSTGATSDFDEYAEEVSVWVDGEEYGRFDANLFKDDNNYDKTVTLEDGAIIRADKEGDLVVAVSGIRNLDSTDAGDSWTLEFESVRFEDASGAIITDSTTGDINDGAGRTFSFDTFASATDTTLKFALGEDNPDSQVVNVDASDDTDGVMLLEMTMEADGGSDIRVRDLPVTLTAVGVADIDLIANTLYAEVDGEEFSESIATSSTTATITFEDFDYTIKSEDKVTVKIWADINDLEGTFGGGDTLTASFTADNRNASFGVDAEDESGEDLVASDRTGTALGEAMAFYDVAPSISLVSISTDKTTSDSANNDSATFTIKYDVTAVDGDIYVSDTDTATIVSDPTSTVASNQVLYLLDASGTATTVGVGSSTVSFQSDGNRVTDTGVTNGVKITEGSTGHFTLTVVRQNASAAIPAGSFRAALVGVSWATTDTATQNVYDFNLEDYESNYVTIN